MIASSVTRFAFQRSVRHLWQATSLTALGLLPYASPSDGQATLLAAARLPKLSRLILDPISGEFSNAGSSLAFLCCLNCVPVLGCLACRFQDVCDVPGTDQSGSRHSHHLRQPGPFVFVVYHSQSPMRMVFASIIQVAMLCALPLLHLSMDASSGAWNAVCRSLQTLQRATLTKYVEDRHCQLTCGGCSACRERLASSSGTTPSANWPRRRICGQRLAGTGSAIGRRAAASCSETPRRSRQTLPPSGGHSRSRTSLQRHRGSQVLVGRGFEEVPVCWGSLRVLLIIWMRCAWES